MVKKCKNFVERTDNAEYLLETFRTSVYMFFFDMLKENGYALCFDECYEDEPNYIDCLGANPIMQSIDGDYALTLSKITMNPKNGVITFLSQEDGTTYYTFDEMQTDALVQIIGCIREYVD